MFARLIRRWLPLGALLVVVVASPAEAVAQDGATSAECRNGMAGQYPCKRVDLESFLPLPILGEGNGNDIWGWTDRKTGHDYAIMGTSGGTAFVDVTDPENPLLVGRLPDLSVPDFLLWRDIKVDGHHAFIVSERTGSGLDVFDLRRLRGRTTPTVFTPDATYNRFSYAHNIAVNRQTDYAYVVGSNTCENGEGESGGLHMVDISNPENPRFAGCARVRGDGDEETESHNYVHDVQCVIYRGADADYRGREICFGSNEQVVAIYDVTNKKNPRVISLVHYPTAAYTHQGWLTPDHKWFLFGDELDELDGTVDSTTTYVLKVSDLDNPPTPKADPHGTQAIDHNLYTHKGRVYESNYSAGLRIFDYSRRSLREADLPEVAFFDVFPPGNPTEFVGTWSNYPYFDSGIVVVSTIEGGFPPGTSGLFVLRPRFGDAGDREATCAGREATMTGTYGDDEIYGTDGRDVIVGRAGDDEIYGRGGNDVICGNKGADRLRGGSGDDILIGGQGDDNIKGGSGDGDEASEGGLAGLVSIR